MKMLILKETVALPGGGGGGGGGEDSCMIMKQTNLSSKSHLVLLFCKLYHVFS